MQLERKPTQTIILYCVGGSKVQVAVHNYVKDCCLHSICHRKYALTTGNIEHNYLIANFPGLNAQLLSLVVRKRGEDLDEFYHMMHVTADIT